jgi:hypothetical protein
VPWGLAACALRRTRPCSLFVWLINHQPAVLFSQNKSATSNQPTVLFSQNKSAPAISHQPNDSWSGMAGGGARCARLVAAWARNFPLTAVLQALSRLRWCCGLGTRPPAARCSGRAARPRVPIAFSSCMDEVVDRLH